MIYRIAIAVNMLACAFLPGAYPRETLSGYMGRHNDHPVGQVGAAVIDLLYGDPEHCSETYAEEAATREAIRAS